MNLGYIFFYPPLHLQPSLLDHLSVLSLLNLLGVIRFTVVVVDALNESLEVCLGLRSIMGVCSFLLRQ